MTVGIIATLKVQDGKSAEFETVLEGLSAAVRANEPGNRLYGVFKSRADANTYVVMEIYDSEDALNAHRATEHFRAGGPKLGPLLAGKPDVQYFDPI
jgi:quinol monooxygenase YgiN